MNDDSHKVLANAWDLFDAATRSILTAQPTQMTAAADKLESARVGMGAAVKAVLMARAKERPPTAAAQPTKPASPDRLRSALSGLVAFVERDQCSHEDTYRGGTNWTICSACGCKWADDEGGFKPYEPPAELVEARDVLGI